MHGLDIGEFTQIIRFAPECKFSGGACVCPAGVGISYIGRIEFKETPSGILFGAKNAGGAGAPETTLTTA
jgi:hypothetical protein